MYTNRLTGIPERSDTRDEFSIDATYHPLHLPAPDFRRLLDLQGPSLALWRGAEIAALRTCRFETPVLDLGCGDGIVTEMVLPAMDYGVDPDPVPLRQAASRGIYRELIAAPAEEMPIPDGSIGTIISNSVVEHLDRLDAVLAAVSRSLRPSGRFIFTTPAPEFSHWLVLPSRGYAAHRNRQLAHLTLLSSQQWSQRLRGVGLEVETVQRYLRRGLVWSWDALELLQQVWIGDTRLFSLLWSHMPDSLIDAIADLYSATDLSAHGCGGGQLIVARKR